jgi:hypothetical protein
MLNVSGYFFGIKLVLKIKKSHWGPPPPPQKKKRRRRILTIKDHAIETVRSFKYLRTVISSTNDETEEIKARKTAANKAYSLLPTTYRCTQIHRNNKIRLYETLMKPVLCYGSVTWTLTQMTEREILRIYGPIQDKGC